MLRQTLTTSLVLAAAEASTSSQVTSFLSQTQEVNLADYTLNVADCVEADTYTYTTFPIDDKDDLYFNSAAYQGENREKKMTDLWSQIEENDSIVCQRFGGMTDLFK